MKKHSLLLALAALSFSSFAAPPQGAEVAKGVNNATLQFVLDKPATISYGPPKGPWIEKNFEAGGYACFGPNFGVKFSLATPRPICRFTLKDGGLVVATPTPPVVTPTPTPTPVIESKFVAGQSGKFTLTQTTAIKFGGQGKFFQKTLLPNTYTCEDSFFGDPLVGLNKSCYTVGTDAESPPQSANRQGTAESPLPNPTPTPTPTPTPAVTWSKLVNEFERFELKETRRVRIGLESNGKDLFVSTILNPGTYACGIELVKGQDPLPGVAKRCDVSSEAGLKGEDIVVTPTPTPQPSTPPTSELINTPEKYRAVAATYGYAESLRFRYGERSQKTRTSVTYPTDRWVRSYTSLSGDSATVQKDGITANRGCSKFGYCGVYNIGEDLFGYTDDYSSTIGNFGYIPVKPVPNGIVSKTYLGFGSAEILNMGHNTMSTMVQPSWTTYINTALDNTLNDENVARYAKLQAGGRDSTKFDMKICPVATTRGYGRGGWTTNAIGLNCEGWIFGYGSNTAHNFMSRKVVPDGFTPTGITITNSGEFAFVSAWDRTNIRGVVYVVALTDACQWCAGEPASNWGANWGSARDEYAGMPGLGNYAEAKVVGRIDLPEGMKAPTDLAVTTGKYKGAPDGYQRTTSFWIDNFLSEGNRKRFYDGDWVGSIARSGILTVADKYAKSVAFYDLRPLFMFYREQYFTKNQNDWNAMMASRGQDAKQWPYTFDVSPSQKPTLIKTVTLPSEVTAIELTRHAPNRALIGTMDGEFRVFDLGNGYLDQMAKTTGNPDDIKQMFSMQLGKNITSIAFKKEIPDWDGSYLYAKNSGISADHFFWVASREEQQASFIEFNKDMTSAKRKFVLEEARITDMVKLSDADNHGTESYVLTIGDMYGMALHNIMYGPITMRTANQQKAPCTIAKPCGLTGGKQFEYVNSLKVPGYVFDITSSNIN